MKIELMDGEGVVGTIELTPSHLKELREALGLGNGLAELTDRFSQMVAKLAEKDEDHKAARLATPTPEEQAQDALEKANYILSGVSDETARQILDDAGKGHLLQVAEVTEPTPEELESAESRRGKVDEFGWRYLPYLDLSYKV